MALGTFKPFFTTSVWAKASNPTAARVLMDVNETQPERRDEEMGNGQTGGTAPPSTTE